SRLWTLGRPLLQDVAALFPALRHLSTPGLPFLGSALSMDTAFLSSLVQASVATVESSLARLAFVDDPQAMLTLLRACVGVPQLTYLLRTVPPSAFNSAAATHDHLLQFFLQGLVTGDGPGFGTLQSDLACLPTRYGGLGIWRASDILHFAFLASHHSTAALQDSILGQVAATCPPPPNLPQLLTSLAVALSPDAPDVDSFRADLPSQHSLADRFFRRRRALLLDHPSLPPGNTPLGIGLRHLLKSLGTPHANAYLSSPNPASTKS
ncbi:hypothetical protein HDU96_004513, partial [Phlyctochytrium bullatum]